MLIICAGMQKSGSGYVYNVLNELIELNGGNDARRIKEKYRLEAIMKWYNNNIDRVTNLQIIKLVLISLKEGDFTVKTHDYPRSIYRILTKIGLVKILYSYRDPRDVYLSATDHGRKIREKGENHTFAIMDDPKKAMKLLTNWISIWHYYMKFHAFAFKYEAMTNDPFSTFKQISQFLKLDLTDEKLKAVISKYDKDVKNVNKSGLHLNKGISKRYLTDLDPNVLKKIQARFKKDIFQMGYEV